MEGYLFLAFLAFWPMVGAFVAYIIGRQWKKGGKRWKLRRDYVAQGVTAIEFISFVILLFTFRYREGLEFYWHGFCGKGIHLQLDGFRLLYGMIAAFMWMMTMFFSGEYFNHYRNRNRYYLFNLITLGATVGVFLSADLYTTFLFFEVMSLASYVWVVHDERKESMRAGETYLAIAIIGGLVMLMGLFWLDHCLGTLEMSELLAASEAYENKRDLYIAGGLLLFGFGAKAGAFPMHIWLPKAHPVAPAPASALLSGILTKTGIFGILVITCNIFLYDYKWGMMLLFISLATMFGGALLALFSVDLKRTLACSSMSQIGFILVGISMQCLLGEENGVAVRGTLLHMVNHSLIKLVLFMTAGVIYMNIHKLNLNEIRGYGRKKPLLNFIFLMGYLGIDGVPLWNGYDSKTLLHESIVEATHLGILHPVFGTFTEWFFLICGGMTVAYMTKLYVAIFWEKNQDAEIQMLYDGQIHYMSLESGLVLGICAAVLPLMGTFSHAIMDNIADIGQGFMHLPSFHETIDYFSLNNLRGGVISIGIGVLIYVFVVRSFFMRGKPRHKIYPDLWPKWLDLENLIYRPLLLNILPGIFGGFFFLCDHLVDWLVMILRRTIYREVDTIPEDNWAAKAKKWTTQKEKAGEARIGQLQVSISYGLLLACVGLTAILLYVLH